MVDTLGALAPVFDQMCALTILAVVAILTLLGGVLIGLVWAGAVLAWIVRRTPLM